MTPNSSNPKSAPKPQTTKQPKGLVVRTTVKAGDPGMRMNHSVKLAMPR